MELILNTLFQAFLFWLAFKVGEHAAYFRIARGLHELKEHAKETVEVTKGIAKIEKIGEQYYAYIDNNFVAQADTVEKVHEAIKLAIEREPSKYIGALKQQSTSK